MTRHLVPFAFGVVCSLLGGTVGTGSAEDSEPSYKPYEFSGKPLKGLRVALDIGHTRLSPGAMSAMGRGEFLFNAATTKVIERILGSAGAEVILVNGDGMIG